LYLAPSARAKRYEARSIISWAVPLIVCAITFYQPATAAPESAIVLKQWSQLNGVTSFTVSKIGLRFEIPHRHLVMVCAPPKWDTTLYNTSAKLYFTCPPERWRTPIAAGSAFIRPADPTSLRVSACVDEKYKELDCCKQTLKQPPSRDEQGESKWQKLIVRDGVLYTLRSPKFSAEVAHAFSRTLGTPLSDGIPVALDTVNHQNSKNEEVKLQDHSTKTVSAADFQLPANFKAVSKIDDVTNSDYVNQGFADFIK
jgi:hypothetical protein